MVHCSVRPLSRAVLPFDWVKQIASRHILPMLSSPNMFHFVMLTIVSITCPKLRVVGEGSAFVIMLVSIFSEEDELSP
jgi:hypothetical protein